jgi:hypothetical protein
MNAVIPLSLQQRSVVMTEISQVYMSQDTKPRVDWIGLKGTAYLARSSIHHSCK